MVVRLTYDAPYDWGAALAFLGHRAVDGVEQIADGIYCRTFRYGSSSGTMAVAHDKVGAALVVTIQGLEDDARGALIERVRRMFDLDADHAGIAAHLSRDPWMAPLVAERPAIRVFRGWDPFEVAVRSIIGQQVTVARARQLNGILVDRCGAELVAGDGPVRRLFPTAQQVLDAGLSAMGMPGARVTALKSIASAALADPHLFERAATTEETVARLRGVRGIGEWTAHYVAMRACGDPDAFPASDIGLLRGAADASGRRPTAAELLARAEAWRPWRAYAAHHLWALDASRVSTERNGAA